MHFEPNLAAIVGPNGSGKSNISDAVLWVLGERNAKNLRGQYMEDVIFAGSSARKAVSVAEVELCLDNSDGTLPVDYAEVSIGRRMYRNGESEYLINGTVVRRMDVLDILHDSGLGTGTNSIISQGNLDSVLSSKPEDRRTLIEEAAGILKHKERKAKAQRKLERMEANVVRIKDIVSEVERQLGPLKRKANKARLYEEVSQDLFEHKLQLAVDDLRVLQTKWEEEKARDVSLANQLHGLEESLTSVQNEIDTLQQRLAQRSAEQGNTALQYRRIQTVSERLNSLYMVLEEKKRHAAADVETLTRQLEETRRSFDDVWADLHDIEAKLAKSCTEREELSATLSQLEQGHTNHKIKRSELRKKIETSTATQRSYTHKIETIQAAKEALKEDLSIAQARMQVIDSQVCDKQAHLEREQQETQAAREVLERSTKALALLEDEEKTARQSLTNTLSSRDELRAKVDAVREQSAQLHAQVAALEERERSDEASNRAQQWALEHVQNVPDGPEVLAGAHAPGQTYALSLKPFIHMFSVDKAWEAAVELVLAYRLQALVVDSADTHIDAFASFVQALQHSTMSGDVTFLLPDVCIPDADAKSSVVVLDKRTYTPLLQHIHFHENYQTLHGLFDGVYCVESLADALHAVAHLAAEDNSTVPGTPYVFVTPDGAMLDTTGMVRVCNKSEEEKEQSLLARRRALLDLRKQDQAISNNLVHTQQQLQEKEEELRLCQAQSLKLSEQCAQSRGALHSARREYDKHCESLQTAQDELKQLQQEQIESKAFLDKALPQADSLDSELSHYNELLVQEKQALASFEETLAPIQRAIVQASQDISETRLCLARLDERIAYNERMIASRKREIENAECSSARARKRIGRARIVAERIDPLIAVVTSLGASAGTLSGKLEEQTGSEQAYTRELSDTIATRTQQSRTMRQSYDNLVSERSEIRVAKGRLEVQVEAAIAVIVQECDTPLEQALDMPVLANREETQAQADKLERRIKSMGSVSIDAAQEYEDVKTRYEYLVGQLRDMNMARRSLQDIVAVIDARMKLDFITTFDQVNENFQEIFSTLFPGGNAYLSLDDPDNPDASGVEVNAHPLGKRLKKMSLLSGGEKSMTALALLFAVYKIRATPFYILDEVEAALDDTNLRRLLAYLDTIRHSTQFIMITHQRRTMEQADILYGVSMQSDGVTKVISQKLDHAQDHHRSTLQQTTQNR